MFDDFAKEYIELQDRYQARNRFLPVLFADAFVFMHSEDPEERQGMLDYWKQLKERIGALEGGH